MIAYTLRTVEPDHVHPWHSHLQHRTREECLHRAIFRSAVRRWQIRARSLWSHLSTILPRWWPYSHRTRTQVQIRVRHPDGTQRQLTLSTFPAQIGRSSKVQIQLRSPRVSKRHAEIRVQQQQVWIKDLHSTNGTFRNGQRLPPGEPIPLQEGDELRIGNHQITIESIRITRVEAPSATITCTTTPPTYLSPAERPFQHHAHPDDRWVRFHWDGETGWLRLPALWIRACWEHLTDIPTDVPWTVDAIQEGIAQFVLLQICAELADALPHAVQPAGWCTPEAADALPAPEFGWMRTDLHLQVGTHTLSTTLLVPLESTKPSPVLHTDDWPIPIGVCVGVIHLRIREWRMVEPGDVLLPDIWTLPQDWYTSDAPESETTVWIHAGTLWRNARLQSTPEGLKLTVLDPWLASPDKGWPMTEKESPTEGTEHLTLDDLELDVVIELDRMTVPLRELRQWQEGHTLVLSRRPDDPVRLILDTGTQRRVLAEGRVIVVDGQIGIEIIRVRTHIEESGE